MHTQTVNNGTPGVGWFNSFTWIWLSSQKTVNLYFLLWMAWYLLCVTHGGPLLASASWMLALKACATMVSCDPDLVTIRGLS